MPRALRAIGTKKPVQTGQMRKKGVEPIHPNREQEPESCASTNFATFAYEKQCKTTATTNRRRHALYSRTPPYASFFCLSAFFAAFLGRSMSLSLHTSFFLGRALYVAIAPYELGGALSAKPIRDACSYAIARKRPIRSAIALSPAAIRALARSMSLSLHTSSGAPYRQSRYGTPAATLLPASGQYAPLSPYRLRQYGLSRALCRYRSIRARGAAEAAVAVVKNCCECDEWPLQSSSMDDCMTNAKKSSKEPPVVRVPSCTYSHALHIQSQAPSSLRRPSPVLTTK